MRIISKVVGAGWAGWAMVMLGLARLGYGLFEVGNSANYSAVKRAKRWGAGR